MTDFSVSQPIDEAELLAYAECVSTSYGIDVPRSLEGLRKGPIENLRVVRADGRVVGGLKWYALGQWFGGRCIPCDGIAAVAIAPPWRGRGAAQALMGGMLRERAAAGVPISTLYPATVPLYRRMGYALAGLRERVELPLAGLAGRVAAAGAGSASGSASASGSGSASASASASASDSSTLELVELDAADFPAMEAAQQGFAAARSGSLRRDAILWERVRRTDARDARHFAVRAANGAIEAYATIRPQADGIMGKDLELNECVVNSAAAGRLLLASLESYSTICANVVFHGGAQHPLCLLAAHGRFSTRLHMPWMTRLVDVVAALEARGYPHGLSAELHLDVRDDVIPANDRRLVLELGRDLARVSEGGQGLLRIDVRGLAMLYTGHVGAHELVTLGLLAGSPADLASLGAAFALPAPWMSDFF